MCEHLRVPTKGVVRCNLESWEVLDESQRLFNAVDDPDMLCDYFMFKLGIAS